jgi:alkylhydroperoxidase family enzyme
MFMRIGGMRDRQIEKLEQDVETARLEPRVNLALDFARRVSRSNPPPGLTEKKALLEAGYSEAAIRELALFAGVVVFHNRFATLLALPPRLAERVSRTPLPRLLRFRFRKIMERFTSRAPQEPPSGRHHSGRYAQLTEALDGLPHGRVLRKLLDEAWASPLLPPRTKAMIFAVIARGLGAAAAEREACRCLVAEGLAEDQIEEILANLASRDLDGREARILPYVRETIWYQPAPVQRRGRALREVLSNDQFLETVGTVALANMVCRVSLAIDEP